VVAAVSGASVVELMHRVGHASPQAARRYQHASVERDRVVAELVAEMRPSALVVPIEQVRQRLSARSRHENAFSAEKPSSPNGIRTRLATLSWWLPFRTPAPTCSFAAVPATDQSTGPACAPQSVGKMLARIRALQYDCAMAQSYEIPSTAAGLLQLARLKSGLSQRQLADRAGVPATMISAYEHDRRQPTLGTLLRLLRAAGYDLRLQLVPADNDDDVLARLENVRSPRQRARRDRQIEAWRHAQPVSVER